MKENKKRSRWVRTETADPWRGGEMRMPIGASARFYVLNDDDSVLTAGLMRYIRVLTAAVARRGSALNDEGRSGSVSAADRPQDVL